MSYEGSKEVNYSKLTLLKCQYKMFIMKENETIQSMSCRIQVTINELRSLEENVACDIQSPKHFPPLMVSLRNKLMCFETFVFGKACKNPNYT